MGKLDETLAILNGLVGDYLSRTDNGLATEMSFYRGGRPLQLAAASAQATAAGGGSRLAVLAHGVMCTEAVWRFADGSDYGSRLQAELGFSPFYLRYNSGLPIADNGRALSQLLAALVEAQPQPIEELLLIGYSMGGLLVRSACHFASESGAPWLGHVRRAIYVGTPHAGAPAERLGRVMTRVLGTINDPYTRLIADLGNLRSAGVKDLGDADLRDQDRAGQHRRLSLREPRHPVPLLPAIRHYLIAGSLSNDPQLAALFGDTLVPVPSATARSLRQAEGDGRDGPHVRVLPGLNHVDLAHHADVYTQIKSWCEEQV